MFMKRLELTVGGFLLLGILALMLLAFQFSGFSLDATGRTYTLFATFDDIGGLRVRSKVTLAGVVVGQVSDISLDEERLVALVRMDIDSDLDQLTSDTSASIHTEGLLGGSYISLVTGAEDGFLRDGQEMEETQDAVVLEKLISEFLLRSSR